MSDPLAPASRDPNAIVSALYQWHNPKAGISADHLKALEAMVVVAYGGPAAEAWQLFMVIGTNQPDATERLDAWRQHQFLVAT